VAVKKPPVPTATTEAAFRSLIRVCGLLKHVMDPYFARFGITGAQGGLLHVLRQAEKEGMRGLRLRDIGNQLLVRPPSVTGLIDCLERLGLVARSASQKDLRAKLVRLTPAGRKLVERIGAERGARIRALLAGLTSKEQKQLHQLLQRLGTHLETLAEHSKGLFVRETRNT